jgi:hypothetical protein
LWQAGSDESTSTVLWQFFHPLPLSLLSSSIKPSLIHPQPLETPVIIRTTHSMDAVVNAAVVTGNLPLLKGRTHPHLFLSLVRFSSICCATLSTPLHFFWHVEMASTVDLRRPRGFKGRNLLHLAVEGPCATGLLDVVRYLVEEKGSTSTEGN